MSNHFPSVPGDLELASINYLVTTSIFNINIVSGSPFYFSSDVSAQAIIAGVGNLAPLSGSGDIGQFLFQFDTPGTFGSFDQDSIETAISTSVTYACQSVADCSGQSLATIQSSITIYRSWIWNDGSGYQLTFQDTMTYP